jgi:hypothetical protein
MDAEIKVVGEGVVSEPVEMKVDDNVRLEPSRKSGFDPKKTQDARYEPEGDEGGVIAPRKKDTREDGGVVLSGFTISYYTGDQMTTTEAIQTFDTVDDAKASVVNAKTCYALIEGRGVKMCQITSGAPRISIGDKEVWVYIEGEWKKV